MIKYNNRIVDIGHFPDGTLLMKEKVEVAENSIRPASIAWHYENDEELIALYFLTKHLQSKGVTNIELKLPYIPNARLDRVKKEEDIFTLKYFAEMINALGFSKVTVLDPHSYVSEALIDCINIQSPKKYVDSVLKKMQEKGEKNILLFFPDEGGMKRYSSLFAQPYVFGIKKRDWVTGKIEGLTVSGQTDLIPGSTILIIDDICSRGGTFYHSAKALKEIGAKEVYLYISHCENTILDGDILTGDLIRRVYTTNSIFTKQHEKVEVFDYD